MIRIKINKNNMDIKTKIQIIVSLVLVALIGLLTWWIQIPTDDIKAQLIDDSPTVLIRIKDFEFTPDVVKVDKGTTVSWLNDETDANAGVQHNVASYDPEDSTKSAELFDSELLSQGDTFSYEFLDEGAFYYNSPLHPYMTGKVCVGTASEEADPDCVGETTEAEGTLGGTETTTTTTTTTSPSDILPKPTTPKIPDTTGASTTSPVTTTTTTTTASATGVGAGEDILPPLASPEVASTTLKTAADEEFKPNVSPNSTSTTMTTTTSTGAPKTASSGPEDVVYIFVAMISVFIAKKYLSRSTGVN